MMNLAGITDADRQIGYELGHSGIPVVEASPTEVRRSRVPFTLAGRLGSFYFLRYRDYWSVTGNLPLGIAEKLYDDPIGRTDVRVAGNRSCLSPAECAVRLMDDGSYVLGSRWGNTAEGFSSFGEYVLRSEPGVMGPNPILHDDPAAKAAKLYITSYDIDSQEGLDLFARTVREEVIKVAV